MKLSSRVVSNLLCGCALLAFAALSTACAGSHGDPVWAVRPAQKVTLAPGYEAVRVSMGKARIIETASRKRAGTIGCFCGPPSTQCCRVDLPSPIDPDKILSCKQSLCPGGVPCHMNLGGPSLLNRLGNLFRW